MAGDTTARSRVPGPAGKGRTKTLFSPPDPQVGSCHVPFPPLPSCKPAFGFLSFYSQSITPLGFAVCLCPAGDSPQHLCSQRDATTPLTSMRGDSSCSQLVYRVATVFCKPGTWQDSSFGAGQSPTMAESHDGRVPRWQSPTAADSNRRQGGEGAISRLTDTSFLPSKQGQPGETKTAQGLGGCQKSREPHGARHARTQRDGAPGAEQGRLRLILTDRKYVLKMKCPDRLWLRWSPRRSLRSGGSGCSSSAVRSSYGDTGFGERAAGERGRCGDRAEVPSSKPKRCRRRGFGGSQTKMLRLRSQGAAALGHRSPSSQDAGAGDTQPTLWDMARLEGASSSFVK